MSIRPIFPADVHLTNEQSDKITRRYTNKDYRVIDMLHSKIKKRAPKTAHDCIVRIDTTALAAYYDKAEITLFDGIPLKEFDCIYTAKDGDYLFQYRISPATNHEGYVLNARRPCMPKIEVFIIEPGEHSTPYPEKVALLGIDKEGKLVPQYCILGFSTQKAIEKDFQACEAHCEDVLCTAQNILIVTNWLLMNKSISYSKRTDHKRAKITHTNNMTPSKRTESVPIILSKHEINFDNRGHATITGNTRLRLTWFWLQSEHIRTYQDGRTALISACMKGPGRDSPEAQAALAEYNNKHSKRREYIVK